MRTPRRLADLPLPAGRDAGRVVALLLGYLGLTLWLTWPLAAHLAVKLPCTDPACSLDTVYSAWVVSWLSHAVTTAPWHLGDANIYYPDPRALYYGPAGFGALPYGLPAFVATGNAALTLNTALLCCVASTALALHWVVWRWTGSTAAGFVAAWTLLMNRWFLWGFVATTPHLAAIQYLPLIVFLAAEPLRTRRRALALLGLVTVQCLTDPVYVAPAVLAPLGVLAVGRIARRPWRASGWRLLGVLAAVPLCLAPVLIGYARVRLDNPLLAQQTPWPGAPAFTIAGAFPTDLSSLFWRMAVPTSLAPPIIALIGLGAVAGALRRRLGAGAGLGSAWRHAALWALAGTWISLSPVASWGLGWARGLPTLQVYLPQYLLAVATPFYQIVRVPVRLGVAGMIGLCLLAGVAFAELARALAARRGLSSVWLRTGAAVGIAVLAYHLPPVGVRALPARYPLQNAPQTDPGLLGRLRATEGPLLELPALDLRRRITAPRSNVLAMYRSTLHWRPLVNGYSSYWPAGFIERLEPSNALPSPLALERLVCTTGVRTILVNLAAFPVDRQAVWLGARTAPPPGLELLGEYPGQLLFAVTLPPPGQPGGPCPGAGNTGG